MLKQRILKIAKWTGISLVSFFVLVSILLYAFKGKIINYVVSEVNQHLAARVDVEKIDLTFWKTFPSVSIDFNKVLVYDTIQNTNDTVLYSELIRLKFNALKLWNKHYVLEEAQIYPGVSKLVEYADGRSNYMIFKTKQDSLQSSTPIEFKLEAIKIHDFKLSYTNKMTRQYYSSFIHNLSFKGDFQATKFDLKTKAKLTVLSIQNQEIQLLKNKKAEIDLKLIIDKTKDLVQIPRSAIQIENLPFEVTGDFYAKSMYLNIKGKNLQLQDLINNLLADRDEITQYKGKGIATFDLTVTDDDLAETAPIVNCIFNVKNGQLTEPTQKLAFYNINVDGQYSNAEGLNKEFIQLKRFDFNSNTGPFSGQFLLTNFANPNYKGVANGLVNLEALSKIVHVPEIDNIKGLMKSQLQFDISSRGDSYKINNLTGEVQLEDAAIKTKIDPRTFSGISGNITFNKDEAYVKDFKVQLKKSDLTFNGEFKNIEQFISNQGNIIINANLTSNYININDLSPEKEAESEKLKKEINARQFALPEKVTANLNVTIDKLHVEKHDFNSIQSNLTVSPHQLVFTNLAVENAGIRVQGNLAIKETSPEYLLINTALNSSEINFKNLLKEWNNFDQTVIKDENVDGYAVVNMNLSAPFDLRSGIVKNEITSTINLKIINGTLKNVEVFKTVIDDLKKSAAKLVINKKQMDLFGQKLLNLKFDVLENNFTIANGKVIIPEMKINSNALDLTLSGWHNFDNNVDYRFSFRLRDITKDAKETEFGIITDDGSGFYVFMKMTGDITKPHIAWDKDASKVQQKENIEKAKNEARSIFKSEFGIGKKDSTIQNYQHNKKKEVVFEVDYGDKKEEKPIQKEKTELQNKIDKKINEAKKQKEQQVEFELE
jgi:hypothetical protein